MARQQPTHTHTCVASWCRRVAIRRARVREQYYHHVEPRPRASVSGDATSADNALSTIQPEKRNVFTRQTMINDPLAHTHRTHRHPHPHSAPLLSILRHPASVEKVKESVENKTEINQRLRAPGKCSHKRRERLAIRTT